MADSRVGVLGAWFQEWQQPLRRFLARRRAGTSADIDDIAQEVFLRVLRYNSAELVEQPQAYLFKIASNVSAEWAMRANRRLPHQSEWLAELVDRATPDSILEQDGDATQLRMALDKLPARAREILRLHFAEGLAYPDVASSLGVTRKIVKRDTARAYAALRATLDSPEARGARRDAAKTT